MSDKINIKDAQAEIDGLLVAEICRDFGINFREVYPEHILARGVGPEQAFIGLAIKRGHLALPVARADAAAIREAALREALDAAAAETDRLRAAKKKHAHKSDIKGEAMAEGAFQVATALAGLIDKPGKEEALGEMARLGQEFDAAIFSDVEGLYGDGEPRKEVSNEQVARR